MTENLSSGLFVAISWNNAFVRLKGRASFTSGPALKEFGLASLERGCTRFIIDLRECEGMDSTFMGILAGLSINLKNAGGTVIIVNLSPKIMELLRTLGLDQIIRLHSLDNPPAELRELMPQLAAMDRMEVPCPDRKKTTETMVEAHETLIEISEDNLPRFKDVLTFLRDDLKRQAK
ncbi:MAG: STAS domain-containing protein [Lentisphaerae bacterium]|nr:STAS domain-containing protein [Lentisphaerota bacterium]